MESMTYLYLCTKAADLWSISRGPSFGTGRGPAIPLADEMGAGRNGLCGSAGAWCLVRHGSQSAPGCGRMPAMGPALAFVRKNAAQENTRERAWGSSPEGLLPDPP